MFDFTKKIEYEEITIRKRDGTLKWQWQDNSVWRYFKKLTGKDIRIPILTGYPTKFYKFKLNQ